MTEAQKEYIITEKELRWYEGLITSAQSERYAKTIRSRPYKSDAVLDELRGHFAKLYDEGFKDPLVTFDAAVSMMKYGDLKLRTKECEQ